MASNINHREMLKLLQAIGSTEPSTFGEFCGEYPDTPAGGDRDGWRKVMRQIRIAEEQGYLEVKQTGNNIDSLQVTASGLSYIKDHRRGF